MGVSPSRAGVLGSMGIHGNRHGNLEVWVLGYPLREHVFWGIWGFVGIESP